MRTIKHMFAAIVLLILSLLWSCTPARTVAAVQTFADTHELRADGTINGVAALSVHGLGVLGAAALKIALIDRETRAEVYRGDVELERCQGLRLRVDDSHLLLERVGGLVTAATWVSLAECAGEATQKSVPALLWSAPRR